MGHRNIGVTTLRSQQAFANRCTTSWYQACVFKYYHVYCVKFINVVLNYYI
jgi:hypothetical protein